jgi:hypothetical protein
MDKDCQYHQYGGGMHDQDRLQTTRRIRRVRTMRMTVKIKGQMKTWRKSRVKLLALLEMGPGTS